MNELFKWRMMSKQGNAKEMLVALSPTKAKITWENVDLSINSLSTFRIMKFLRFECVIQFNK